jgi:HK97 family phage major capsid protein
MPFEGNTTVSTRTLLAERSAVADEMRAIHSTAPDGALSESAEARFNVLKASLVAIDGRVERQVLIDEMDRRTAGSPVAGADNRLDTAIQSFSVVRALAGAAGLAVDWGREKELGAEVARRSGRSFQGICIPLAALSSPIENRVFTSTLPAGGPGSAIIATNLMADQTIDRLRAQLVIRQLGARVLSGLTGNVAIPRLKGSASAAWVAENTAITATDPQTDQVTLAPHTAGAITEFSRLLLLQGSPDVESLVRGDLTAVLAQALDLAAIQGTGASNQPRGILSTVGIGSLALGTNGAALTYANVVDLMGQTQDLNAESSNAFLSNYKVRRAVQKLVDTTGRPLGESVVFQNVPRAYTTNVPNTLTKGTAVGICSALIYGDFSQLLVGLWSELDILVNPYESTAYSKGNVQVRAMLTCDISVRHPESFAAAQDILA